jgi:peptidyl-tRNA hydrolase
MADYVLDRFRPSEKAIMEETILLAAQAVGVWIHRGVEACMNEFNAGKAD